MSKMASYKLWVEEAEAKDMSLLSFDTPCCGKSIKTMAPSVTGVMWDSIALCPHCDNIFFKEVYVDRVEASFSEEVADE